MNPETTAKLNSIFGKTQQTEGTRPSLDSIFKPKPQEQGFGSHVGEDLSQRAQNIQDIQKQRTAGETGLGEAVGLISPEAGQKVKDFMAKHPTLSKIAQAVTPDIATTGQLAGGVQDVIGEVLSSITPEKIKEWGAEKTQQVMKTALGQAGIKTAEDYANFAEKNPLLAKNIEGAINIGLTAGDIIGVGESASAAKGAVKAVAEQLPEDVVAKTGRVIKKAGEKTYEAAVPVSAREAGILQTYKAKKPFLERVSDILSGTEKKPRLTAKTGIETGGLFGTKSGIGVRAKRASGKLWNDLISPALKSSSREVDAKQFFNDVRNEIISANPEKSRQSSLLEALDAIEQDYSDVGSVKLDELQKLKEGWAQFVPEKAYQGKPITGAYNEVRNLLSGKARGIIYDELGPDVKKAYIDYGNLKGLQEWGKTAMTGTKLKGGTGSLISEIYSQFVTPIATSAGKTLYNIGKGIELVGEPGAKTLGEVLESTK